MFVFSTFGASCGKIEFNLVNPEIKIKPGKTPSQRAHYASERKAVREKWEAGPDGIRFKEWEVSPIGKKVRAAAAKILIPVRDSILIEAIVTSLTLPPGSRLGFAVMVRVQEDDYILSFGHDASNEFQHLRKLKLKDKIRIKSQFVSYAPKYAYPIISGDYVELDRKIVYKRGPRKDGC